MHRTAYAAGATSKSIEVRAFTTSTGAPKTDLVFNTSGIAASYWRGPAGTVTSITLVTQTSTGAYTSGGFVHKSGGVYRLDVPDAALAAGVDWVTFSLSGVSDCTITSATADLVSADPRSAFTLQEIAEETLYTFGGHRGHKISENGTNIEITDTDGTTLVVQQPRTRSGSALNPIVSLG